MKKIGKNLTKVIQLLGNEEFHDGTSIGQQLNITRTAVWKMIKKLQGYDVPVQSVKGKGYSLDEPLLLLDKQKMKPLTKSIHIDLFERLNSTNEYLKSFCVGDKIRVCISEMQTQGKGRFHRHWHSPFGKNLYLSMLYPFSKDISELAGLNLVIGLSICKTLEKLYQLPGPVLIKWPNDILCSNEKLAGSLIEVQAETHGISYAIIGIGINVNMVCSDKNEIDQSWTSIRKLNNVYNNRNELCVKLIEYICSYIRHFEESGFSLFLDEWKTRDSLLNKKIAISSGDKLIEGIAQGINEKGCLLMKVKNGSIEQFSSGDTTIIK